MLIPKAATARLRTASFRFLSCDVEVSTSLALQRESLDLLVEEHNVSALEGAVFLLRLLLSLASCISSCVTYLKLNFNVKDVSKKGKTTALLLIQ